MPTAVSLSQLVDLALGTPEVGAVNLNVLHTLLHAIIAKLNIQDVKADINELDREFLQTYAVPQNREKHGPDKSSDKSGSMDKSNDKKYGADVSGNNDKSTSSDKSINNEKGSFNEKDSVKSVDGSSNEDSFVAPKLSAYHRLELRVAELAKQMENLNALPSTRELFERSVHEKSIDSLPPVAEMWQTMQLKKRVDANEEGIGKLMTMMDDTLREIGSLRDVSNALQERPLFDPGELINRLNDLEKMAVEMQNQLDKTLSEMKDHFASFPSVADFQQFVRWPQLEEALLGIRRDIESISQKQSMDDGTLTGIQTDKKYESDIVPQDTRSASTVQFSRPTSSLSSGPSSELLEALEKIGRLIDSHEILRQRVDLIEEELAKKLDKDVLQNLSLGGEVLKELNRLRNEILDLQKCLKDDNEMVSKLQDMLTQVEKEIAKLTITSNELKEDVKKKSKQMERLFGLCDSLEKKKADKEYVEMEFDVKADKRHLESKVSHSLFDSTTGEINKMIKDLLDKLSGSDSEWKNMLSKLTNDLDGKLDRMELGPLKDWLEAKLKALSKKIQQGQLEWNEDEAAGLRKQLIQHYHCLSCDKPIDILQGQGTALALPPGFNRLPGSRTPRPYITYELDHIRQQGRNMVSPEIVDFYATTRQCGGPHTTTLPHKRLTRMTVTPSPYQKEDVVDVCPVHKEEVSIMGADGQIYRGRLDARMPTQLVSSRQSASYSPTPRGRERPASAKTNAVRKDSAHVTSASPQQLSRPMSASGMYTEKQNVSATFSEKQNGSATFSEKQNRSATFSEKQNGSATFFEKQSGSATFSEKQSGSATNREKQSGSGYSIPMASDHPDEIQDMDMSTAEMDNSRQGE